MFCTDTHYNPQLLVGHALFAFSCFKILPVNDKLRQDHTTSKTPARKMSPVLSFHKPSFPDLGFQNLLDISYHLIYLQGWIKHLAVYLVCFTLSLSFISAPENKRFFVSVSQGRTVVLVGSHCPARRFVFRCGGIQVVRISNEYLRIWTVCDVFATER